MRNTRKIISFILALSLAAGVYASPSRSYAAEPTFDEGSCEYVQINEPYVLSDTPEGVAYARMYEGQISSIYNIPVYQKKCNYKKILPEGWDEEKRTGLAGASLYMVNLYHAANNQKRVVKNYEYVLDKTKTLKISYPLSFENEGDGYLKLSDGNYIKDDTVLYKYKSTSEYTTDTVLTQHNILRVVEKTAEYVKVERAFSGEEREIGYIPFSPNDTYFIDTTFLTNILNKPDRYTHEDIDSSSEIRNAVVNEAINHLGEEYVWGGSTLGSGVDCSGFVQQIYKRFGIETGRNTSMQLMDGKGKFITATSIRPGDLIYYTKDGQTPYHVTMYIGNGECVEAKDSNSGIVIYPVVWSKTLAIKSYIN